MEEKIKKSKIAKPCFAILFATFVLCISAANAFAGGANFFITNTSLKEISPGEVAALNISLKNLGTAFASRIEVELDPSDTSPIDAVGIVRKQISKAEKAYEGEAFGTVKQLESISLSYEVGAKMDAEEGFYNVPLVLTWEESGNEVTQTLYIGIRIKKKDAEFAIASAEPIEIAPGEKTELSITLENTGSEFAKNITVDLDPDDLSPVDSIGPTKKKLDTFLNPGDTVKVSYEIEVSSSTAEDVYYTPLVITWETYKKESTTLWLGMRVKGSIKLGVAGVDTEPEAIKSGDDNVKILVSIENSGEAVARNLKIKLDLGSLANFQPSYSNSEEAYVGRLNSGEAKTASFYIDIDEKTEPGKYAIPLILNYEDEDGNSYEDKKSITLLVEPKPYFELSAIELNPENLIPGERATLKIRIKNTGSEKAEAVDLRVIREAEQPFDFKTRSDFIGILNPGESGEAILEFDVDKNAKPKEYALRLLVRATGDSELEDTNVYTQELKANIAITKTPAVKETEQNAKPYIIAAVGVIFALLAGYALGKRRK